MPLTDTACKNAHRHEKTKSGKAFKLSDEKGLYLLVKPQADGWGKWWRFKYRFGGKEKGISFGTYPEISLAQAREKRDIARKQVADGIDPSESRKALKSSRAESAVNSFEPIAREWWEFKKDSWTEGHANRTLTRLVNDVFPYLGATPINSITAIVLLETIRRIESRGAIETAHRTNQACEGVFAYAIGTGRCDNNPATAIRTVLKPAPPQKNFARLKDVNDIAILLNDIEHYKGSPIVRAALQLLPLTFVRPGELASAEWTDIDFDKALWTVPAHIKKQRAVYKSDPTRVHLVPLSTQAIAILRDMQQLTGRGRYVFTGLRTSSGSKHERHMAAEAMLGALRRMGYSKEDMTTHGFRGIASTRLKEAAKDKIIRALVIEIQLAHKVKGKTEAAYDHAEYLEERIFLMQYWSDYLYELKAGGAVVPFKKVG